jgi:hypothetical protein
MRYNEDTKLIRVRASDMKYLAIIKGALYLRAPLVYQTYADTISWLINLAHDHDPEMKAHLERQMGEVLDLQKKA